MKFINNSYLFTMKNLFNSNSLHIYLICNIDEKEI